MPTSQETAQKILAALEVRRREKALDMVAASKEVFGHGGAFMSEHVFTPAIQAEVIAGVLDQEAEVTIEQCNCGDFGGKHASTCPYGVAHGLVFHPDAPSQEAELVATMLKLNGWRARYSYLLPHYANREVTDILKAAPPAFHYALARLQDQTLATFDPSREDRP